MKLTAPSILVLLIFFCFACNSDPGKPVAAQAKPEPPKALQDHGQSDSFISKRIEYVNLVDQLYNELSEKNPGLKSLEKDKSQYYLTKSDSLKKYNDYLDNSDGYYLSAGEKTKGIKDSVLRKRLQGLVDQSKRQFQLKTKGLQAMLAGIDQNELSLQDAHALLEIMVTLPVIEQYQNDQLPSDKQLRAVSAQLEQLINRTKKLTPKR